jgi:fatty-acyl-CoA synthase
MSGAGLKAQVWQQFQQRFGIEFICEGLGSTEANYGLTNVDGRVGSVGRLPYPERSNIRVVRYEADTGSYPRNADGTLLLCRAGEVGELIAQVLDGPGGCGLLRGLHVRGGHRGQAASRCVPGRGPVGALRGLGAL